MPRTRAEIRAELDPIREKLITLRAYAVDWHGWSGQMVEELDEESLLRWATRYGVSTMERDPRGARELEAVRADCVERQGRKPSEDAPTLGAVVATIEELDARRRELSAELDELGPGTRGPAVIVTPEPATVGRISEIVAGG